MLPGEQRERGRFAGISIPAGALQRQDRDARQLQLDTAPQLGIPGATAAQENLIRLEAEKSVGAADSAGREFGERGQQVIRPSIGKPGSR